MFLKYTDECCFPLGKTLNGPALDPVNYVINGEYPNVDTSMKIQLKFKQNMILERQFSKWNALVYMRSRSRLPDIKLNITN